MLAIFIFILKTYYMTQMIKKKVSTKHCIKWHSIIADIEVPFILMTYSNIWHIYIYIQFINRITSEI